jgi:hypothetical protein
MKYTNYLQILSNYQPNNHHNSYFTEILNNILSTKSYEIIVELFNEHNFTYTIHTINSTILQQFIDNKNDRNTLNNLLQQHLNTGGYEFDIKIYF